MYRIFKAPEREPGQTMLQADRGTWETFAREQLAAGDRELPRIVAAGLGIELATLSREPGRALGEGDMVRITLPTDQARRVLHAAGLDA